MRPPVGERPVGMYQLCAPVLIAAILRSVIRAAEMTPVGACREWPMPKTADDRRGTERMAGGPLRQRILKPSTLTVRVTCPA